MIRMYAFACNVLACVVVSCARAYQSHTLKCAVPRYNIKPLDCTIIKKNKDRERNTSKIIHCPWNRDASVSLLVRALTLSFNNFFFIALPFYLSCFPVHTLAKRHIPIILCYFPLVPFFDARYSLSLSLSLILLSNSILSCSLTHSTTHAHLLLSVSDLSSFFLHFFFFFFFFCYFFSCSLYSLDIAICSYERARLDEYFLFLE